MLLLSVILICVSTASAVMIGLFFWVAKWPTSVVDNSHYEMRYDRGGYSGSTSTGYGWKPGCIHFCKRRSRLRNNPAFLVRGQKSRIS